MHEQLMKRLYAEYAAFKQHELTKEPERIFSDALQIANYEMILYCYERVLPEMNSILFHLVCEKGAVMKNLLQQTHEETLLDVPPIMTEDRFKGFVEDYFL